MIKIWASHGLSTEVVISGAFINFLLHNHIINKIKSFSGDVNYETNFAFFFTS